MRKIRKGDDVIVISGREKGKRGSITSVTPDGRRVFIGGLNMVKKHTKPNPNLNIPGGIVEPEAPLAISNVMLFNPKTSKGDRVGFKVEGDKKTRIFRSTGEVVDV